MRKQGRRWRCLARVVECDKRYRFGPNREKLLAYQVKKWNRPGGGRHQRREKEAAYLETKIDEILTSNPDLKEVLNYA